MSESESGRYDRWNSTWALAVVFGLASVPWTYGFVAGLEIPLWPAFIGSATYFATEERGQEGLAKAGASNLAGILYAAATLFIVDAFFSGGVIALSVVVGVFMFLASLHEFVPVLSFTPGGFFGYATMFSVAAAEATAFGVTGLAGQTVATVSGMFIGAVIGLLAENATQRLS